MAIRRTRPIGAQTRHAMGIPEGYAAQMLKKDEAEREERNSLAAEIAAQEAQLIARAKEAEEINGTEYPAEAEEIKADLPVTSSTVLDATRILNEYKADKQHFDRHVIEDEQWWRQRHWDLLNAKDGETSSDTERGEIDPKSAWLLHNVSNKLADFIDNIPTFAVLPREQGDENTAKMLSAVLPVIFERNDFEEKYDRACEDKCKHGTGVYGVFFDGTLRGGMGDIVITDVDVLRLFWQGGVKDIQDSENVFYVIEITRRAAMEAYPEHAERLQSASVSGTVDEYIDDDSTNKADMCEVVEWYYRKDGKLHYVKYIGDIVLSSTENEPEKYPNGIYAHGMYPFFFDPYFRIKNSPAGFGLIDIGKSDQEQIDRLSRALLGNVLGSSRQKTFIGDSAGVNEEDLADPKKNIIKFSGRLDDSNYRTEQPNANADMYMNVISQKVTQLKETSGNSDVASGGVPTGITAASAIAALQEQAGKTSRMSIKGTYRVFVRIAKCVIELIREFYDMPRIFRIIGDNGQTEYIHFSNADMKATNVQRLDGTTVDIDPEYDIIVSAQKATAYSALAQNELTLQFYNAGFFEPSRADQALMALEMMDFRGKEKIMDGIRKNGTMYQMLATLSERLAAAERMLGIKAFAPQMSGGVSSPGGSAEMPEANASGVVSEEPTNVKRARAQSAATTAPR